MKMNRKYSCRIVAMLALITLIVSGVFICRYNSNKAHAEEYYDSTSKLTWVYTLKDGKAYNLYTVSKVKSTSLSDGVFTIPSSIGNNEDETAFYDVVSLGDSDSDSYRCSAFFKGGIDTSVTSFTVDIPETVEKINAYAFYDTTELTEITLPDTVTSVGDYAFGNCIDTTLTVTNPNMEFGESNSVKYFKGYRNSTLREYYETNILSSDTSQKRWTSVDTTDSTSFKVVMDKNSEDSDSNTELGTDKYTAYYYAYTGMNVLELGGGPSNTHYEFGGYEDSNGKSYYDDALNIVTDTFESDTPYVSGSDDERTLTLSAVWQVKSYNVTLETNGGTINDGVITSYTYDPDNAVVLPSDVTKTGYTFAGWYTDSTFSGNVVTGIEEGSDTAKKYYAKWTANTYSVTFTNNNANASGVDKTITLTYDVAASIDDYSSYFKYTGYTLKSGAEWNTKANGSGTTYKTGQSIKNLLSEQNANIVLYAQWTANDDTEYKVICKYQDLDTTTYTTETVSQTGVSDTTLTADDDVISPENYLKTGFTSDDANASKTVTIDRNGTGTVTYIYSRIKSRLTLNYESECIDTYSIRTESGNTSTDDTYMYGEDITVRVYAADGYSVENISLSASDVTCTSGTDRAEFIMPAKDLTLNITTKNVTYGVSFYANGGEIQESVPTEYTYGSEVSLPTNVIKEGYTFDGWYDNNSLSGDAVTKISATDTNDKQYYAKWEKQSYTVTVTGDNGVSTIEGSGTYSYQKAVTISFTLKDGYTFDKVSLNLDSDEYSTSSDSVVLLMPAKDVTIAITTTSNSYGVTFCTNGGKINNFTDDFTYTYGSGKALPDNVTMAGYTFKGWYDNADLTGDVYTSVPVTATGHLTYYAEWEKQTYTVTYDLNDTVATPGAISSRNYTTTYTYGKGITLPSNVSRDGFTFNGWANSDGETVGSYIEPPVYGNKVFTAMWSDNSSTVVNAMAVSSVSTNDSAVELKNVSDYTAGESDYYFNSLETDEEKRIYATMYDKYQMSLDIDSDGNSVIEPYTDSLTIVADENISYNQRMNASTALFLDHPEIFWVRYYKTNLEMTLIDGRYYMTYYPVDAYDEDTYNYDFKAVRAYYKDVIDKLTEVTGDTTGMDNATIVKKLLDYIVEYYSYNMYGYTLNASTANDTRSVGHMIITKVGCCEGYARLTKVLCDRYDIPCILVSNTEHTWNEIKIGDKWYGFDATWDDDGNSTSYRYTLKGAATYSVDHVVYNVHYIDNSAYVTDYGYFEAPELNSSDYSFDTDASTNATAEPTIEPTDAPTGTDTADVTTGKKITKNNIVYKVTQVSGNKGSVTVLKAKSKKITKATIVKSITAGSVKLSVKNISNNAFKGCKKLKSIDIKADIDAIGKNAFYNDKKLVKIRIRTKKLTKVCANAIKGISAKAVIKVPGAKLSKYKKLFVKKGYVKKTMKMTK